MDTANEVPRRQRWWSLRVVIACLLLITAVQYTARWTDNQIANFATLGLSIIAFIAAQVCWFRHGPNGWRRSLLPLACVVGLAAFLIFFRFIGFSGEMVPRFAYRFAEPVKLPDAVPGSDLPVVAIPDAESADDDESFPEFLGPGRRARLPHRHFTTDWTSATPKILWKQPIGEGWSGFSIVGNAAVTMEQRDEEEWITCYRVDDGTLIWKQTSTAKHSHVLGGTGPRATPTLDGGRVYAQGATGRLWCLSLTDGMVIWEHDLLSLAQIDQTVAEQGVMWGRSGSPLIVDDLVVVPLGETVPLGGTTRKTQSLIAFDKLSGEERWRGGDSQISYASPSLATVAGVRQILITNEDNIAGHDPATGKQLWSYPWTGKSNADASVSQVMPVNETQVMISKGYNGGAALLTLKQDGTELLPVEEWVNFRVLRTKFTNVAIVDGHAYGLGDGALECVRLSDGTSMWKQPRRGRYNHGQILAIEDVLLVLSEAGELACVAIDPEQFRELGRIPVIEGKTWNTMAVTGMRVLVRNSNEAACVQLPPREP